MSAEGIITFVIITICALVFIGIGIAQYKSKEPVGFWSGIEPHPKEKVTNVVEYNKKHGFMWIIYGLGLIIAYLSGVPFGYELMPMIVVIAECFGGLIIMILYHNYLDKKYLIP